MLPIFKTMNLLAKPTEGITWEPYQLEKLTAAHKLGKPAVIDFYADWCLPCHELERYTYSNPNVIQALEPYVRLKADVTNPKTEKAIEPVDRFNILGVPTILFLDPKGKEIPDSRITGFVPPAEFLKHLKNIEASFKNEVSKGER